MSITATSGGSAATSRQELLGGAGLGEDVDALLGEKSGEALADDDGVVGEDHAHGIAARAGCRCRGLSTCRRPSSASTRSRRPRSPAPAVGAADAVVGDLDRDAAVRARDLDRDAGGVRA